MDGRERKEGLSLPPDYVSLAELQKRWLQKEQEKKLKEKEEEEMKERDAAAQNENQNQLGFGNHRREKMLSRVEKDGRKIGVIEDKGKGKVIEIGGIENGDGNKKKKYSSKKKKHFEKKKSAVDVVNEKQRSEIKECDGGDGSEGLGIVPENEVKVNQRVLSVSKMEVLPRYVVREIPDGGRINFRGGFGRNDRNNRGYKSKTEYRVGFNELKKSGVKLALEKMEDENGYGKKWKERGNGDYWERSYRLKESRPYVLKGNEVEPELEKKAEDEVCSELCDSNGRDRSGFLGQSKNVRNYTKEHRVEGEGLSDNCVFLDKKVDDEVLLVESAKNGLWGTSKSGRNNTKENRVEGEGLSDDSVFLDKVDDEVLLVESAKNGFWGKSKNGRNNTKEHRVEGEGLSDDRVFLDKKVDYEVLYVESAENGEKGFVANGHRRYGYGRVNINRRFSGLNVNGWSGGRVRSMVKMNVGDDRRYAGFGGFEDRWKTKQRESGMVWVKKEEKVEADAAEVGSSGISVDVE